MLASMNGLFLGATLSVIAALGGPIFGSLGGRNKPPQPFDEDVVLPGQIPPSATSLRGGWAFSYMLDDAAMEGGPRDLIVGLTLFLRDDGSYQLHYHARWGFGLGSPGVDGRNVTETGAFSLSGEVLLLQPDSVIYADIEKNVIVNEEEIEKASHTLIVRMDKAKLAMAGRCASWQIDPVCKDTPIVWYPMKAQVGMRWLGREPK